MAGLISPLDMIGWDASNIPSAPVCLHRPETPDASTNRAGVSSCPGGSLTAPLPTSVIESRITTADASCLAGVSVATIRKWVQRGHLEVDCRDGLGRPLFRWIDVAKAERATRERARRTYAA